MNWIIEDQVGDLPAAIAYFHSKLPGWWFSVGACHVSADASIAPDSAGQDDWIYKEPDAVVRWFDEGFHADLYPPATMADALIHTTNMAYAARTTYCETKSLDATIAAFLKAQRTRGA